MGSTVSPIVVNLYMEEYERKALDSFTGEQELEFGMSTWTILSWKLLNLKRLSFYPDLWIEDPDLDTVVQLST